MIDLTLEIPDYRWTVHFHCAVTCYHTDEIISELRSAGCPQVALMKAYDLIKSCKKNTGFTYSSSELRESVVVISQTTSAAEFINTLEHEIRHLVDDIVLLNRYYDREDIAYLAGEINRALYPYVRRLLCDDCRRKSEN